MLNITAQSVVKNVIVTQDYRISKAHQEITAVYIQV